MTASTPPGKDGTPRVSDVVTGLEALEMRAAAPGQRYIATIDGDLVDDAIFTITDLERQLVEARAERDEAREERDQFLEQIVILRDGPLHRDFQALAKEHNALLAQIQAEPAGGVTEAMVEAGIKAKLPRGGYFSGWVPKDRAHELVTAVLTAALAAQPRQDAGTKREAWLAAAEIIRPLDLFIAGQDIGGRGYVTVEAVMDLLDQRVAAIRDAANRADGR